MASEPYAIKRIRVADASDTAAFARLVSQLSSRAPLGSDALSHVLANPNNFVFVARDQHGAIVGTASLVVVSLLTGLRSWIEDVVVDEDLRGQGIAGSLIEALLETAHANGCRTVDLTSRPSREAANRLYERSGFARRETNVWRYECGAHEKAEVT